MENAEKGEFQLKYEFALKNIEEFTKNNKEIIEKYLQLANEVNEAGENFITAISTPHDIDLLVSLQTSDKLTEDQVVAKIMNVLDYEGNPSWICIAPYRNGCGQQKYIINNSDWLKRYAELVIETYELNKGEKKVYTIEEFQEIIKSKSTK